jgi:sterol desaturase/sphingolipid hydroxylase (fatty acid hydroxylase superfamily)
MEFIRTVLAAHHHLYFYAIDILRAFLWLAVLMIIFVPLEHVFALHPQRTLRRETLTNVGWYFLNSFLPIFVLGPPTALLAWAIHSVLPDAFTHAGAALPLWARMILAIAVAEIGFYWGHRWSHEIPILWRFHAIHHSPTEMDFLVNTRGHPVDVVFTKLCGVALLLATGLASPVGPNAGLVAGVVLLVGSMWSFFVHANVRWRLGLFEEVLSTPAFHHWHHTYEDHKDLNYAPMLPIVDRIFGTFFLPAHWPEKYGTSTPVSKTLVSQLVDPFGPAPTASRDAPRVSPGDSLAR